MRDGVKLYTRVFLPDPAIWGPEPYPTILTATPYGVAGYTGKGQCSNPAYVVNNDQAAHGYAYAYQAVFVPGFLLFIPFSFLYDYKI